MTGLCDGGCDTGWTGSVCDKGLLEIQLNIILIMCIFIFLYDKVYKSVKN